MYRWLVTVRAADGCCDRLRDQLVSSVMPLLREHDRCIEPELAACIHCPGEHTYLAHWPSEDAVTAFEQHAQYQAALEAMAPLLRVPPKRELWEVLVSEPQSSLRRPDYPTVTAPDR